MWIMARLSFPKAFPQWVFSGAIHLQLRGQCWNSTNFPLSLRPESKEPKHHYIGAGRGRVSTYRVR